MTNDVPDTATRAIAGMLGAMSTEPVSLPKSSSETGFRWTAERHRAALLIAEDDLSHEAIAETIGVTSRTLRNWKQHPEFAAQVGDYVGQMQAAMLRYRVAKKRHRLKVINDLWLKLLTVIDERAEEYAGQAPGGATGTVVKQIKQIGAGRDVQIIEEYATDTATIKQIMALQQMAAQELGQWQDRVQVEGLTTVVEIVGVPEDAI